MRGVRWLALLLAVPAAAQEQQSADQNRTDRAPQVNPEPGSYQGALLFKDWRKRLYDRGIDPHLSFTTELSAGVAGVSGTRFTEQIEIGVKLDMAKVAGVRGGSFNLVLTNREGRDLSTDKIGNLFRTQEVYGANKDLRLVYLTWEQQFANGHLAWLAGRTNVAQDFAYTKLWCNFQNNGLCGRPRSLPANGGFSNYPLSAWGTRLRWRPIGGDSYVQVGAYEANPDLANTDGFQFGFKHDTGVTLPIEGALVVGSEKAGTLGNYKLGGYYDTSDARDQFTDITGQPLALTGRPAGLHGGRATVYAFADQMVARLDNDARRPVTLLAGVTYAPPDRSLFQYEWYLAGLVKGPFAARPGDVFGLMFLTGRVSPDLADTQRLLTLAGQTISVQRSELVAEIVYNLRVTGWLHVTPGAQVIFKPAADTRRSTVTVVDLKTVLNF